MASRAGDPGNMDTRCTPSVVGRASAAVLIAAAAIACSGKPEATPAAIPSAAEAPPRNGVAVRRPSGSRAGRAGQAVHRRLRRAGEASRDPRRRHVQPHALLHRQGAGARARVRVVEAVRERPEHRTEDRQPQGARGDGAHATRSALRRPDQRQGGHGRGHGHRHARAGEARRLLGADAHQRQRSRGHRARSAADRHAWTIWPARRCSSAKAASTTRACPPEQPTEGEGQAGGSHQRGPRRARRRRHPRDGQRRPGPDHRRGRLSGRVLEQGVHRHQGAQGRHRAVRRQPGRRVPQGESPAPRGRQHVAPEARKGRRLPEHGGAPLSQQRQVREERRGR